MIVRGRAKIHAACLGHVEQEDIAALRKQAEIAVYGAAADAFVARLHRGVDCVDGRVAVKASHHLKNCSFLIRIALCAHGRPPFMSENES